MEKPVDFTELIKIKYTVKDDLPKLGLVELDRKKF